MNLGIRMSLNTALSGVAVPFLFLFTLPMAVMAFITTGIACTVLASRVALVYIEIFIGLITQYLTGTHKPPPVPASVKRKYSNAHDGWRSPVLPSNSAPSLSGYSSPSPAVQFTPSSGNLPPGSGSPRRRRSSYFATVVPNSSRRSSQASLRSLGTISPIYESRAVAEMMATIPGDACLTPSVGMDRDFEGVGGWRIDDGDDEDNKAWTNINSRLELPFEGSSPYSRRHQRSRSMGPVVPTETAWLATVDAQAGGEKAERGPDKPQPVRANSSRVRTKKTTQAPPNPGP